jgi:hypothetical protein
MAPVLLAESPRQISPEFSRLHASERLSALLSLLRSTSFARPETHGL